MFVVLSCAVLLRRDSSARRLGGGARRRWQHRRHGDRSNPGRAAGRDGHGDRSGPDGHPHRRDRRRRHVPAAEPAAGREYTVVFELPGFGTFKREGDPARRRVHRDHQRDDEPGQPCRRPSRSAARRRSSTSRPRGSRPTSNAEQIATALVGSRDYAAVMSQVPGVLNHARRRRRQQRDDDAGVSRLRVGRRPRRDRGDQQQPVRLGRLARVFRHGVVRRHGRQPHRQQRRDARAGRVHQRGVQVGRQRLSTGRPTSTTSKTASARRNIDDDLIARGLTSSGDVDVHDLNRFDLFRDFSANRGRLHRQGQALVVRRGAAHAARSPLPGAHRRHRDHDDPGVHGQAHLQHHAEPQGDGLRHLVEQDLLRTTASATRIVTSDALIDEHYPNATDVVHLRGPAGPLGGADRARRATGATSATTKARARSSATTMPARTASTVRFRRRFDERDRPQVNGSLTYFKDGWAGSHSFKFGGEFQHEQQTYTTAAFGPNNMILYLNNNVPTQVDVYLVPNATRSVGRSKSAVRLRYVAGQLAPDPQPGVPVRPIHELCSRAAGTAGLPVPAGQRTEVEPVGAARRLRVLPHRRSEDAGEGKLWQVLGEPGLHAREPRAIRIRTTTSRGTSGSIRTRDTTPTACRSSKGRSSSAACISRTGARADFSPAVT